MATHGPSGYGFERKEVVVDVPPGWHWTDVQHAINVYFATYTVQQARNNLTEEDVSPFGFGTA